MTLLFAILTGALVLSLIAAEYFHHYKDRVVGVWIFKPLASACMVATALAMDTHRAPGGTLVLAALVSCAAGDVLLIPKSKGFFLAGLLMFLSGHLIYATAFAMTGPAPVHLAVGCAMAGVFSTVVIWKLKNHLKKAKKLPWISVYTVAISSMFATAFSAWGAGRSGLLVVGATLFMISDTIVARRRFVVRTFANQAVILPTYYAAQLLIAGGFVP